MTENVNNSHSFNCNRAALRAEAGRQARMAARRAEEAVVRARVALEDARKAAAAALVHDAQAAARAAQKAAKDATDAAAAAASERIVADAARGHAKDPAGIQVQAGRYLVVRNGHQLAAFAREDDALLFEGELAELDVARGVTSARCDVTDVRGNRVGGYVIAGGCMTPTVEDVPGGQQL